MAKTSTKRAQKLNEQGHDEIGMLGEEKLAKAPRAAKRRAKKAEKAAVELLATIAECDHSLSQEQVNQNLVDAGFKIVEQHDAHCHEVRLTTAQIEEADAEEAKRGSIVRGAYKAKYAARGNPRGCGDWLHVTLAGECLNPEGKLDVAKFEALLDANGVKHSHWNRTTAGWQGRLRMTGRLALQTVVAKTGQLKCADGEILDAPEAWVARIAR